MNQIGSDHPPVVSSSVEALMAYSSLNLDQEDQYLREEPAASKDVQKQSYYRLAKIYYDKSDLVKAEKNFIKASKLTETPKDMFSLFKMYGFLVRIYSEKLEADKAEQYIVASEKLLEDASRYLGTLNAEYFYNLGVVQNYRGKFAEAKESFLLAYKKSKEENDPEVLAKSLHAIANGYYHTKDYTLAIAYLDQLGELLKILKKNYISGSMYKLYAKIFTDIGEYEKALDYFKLANRSLLSKNCWNLYSYVLLGQGVVYKKMGDYKKALLLFELAQDVTNENVFRRLSDLIAAEVQDVNDSSVDLYLDRTNRLVYEKLLGTIDFKHRFVLLEILFLLAQNPGKYYSKEDLARSIWKDEYNPLIHDKLIYTSVSRLRKLIEPKDGKRKYILRGKDGYTFNPRTKTRFHKEHHQASAVTIANVEISSPV